MFASVFHDLKCFTLTHVLKAFSDFRSHDCAASGDSLAVPLAMAVLVVFGIAARPSCHMVKKNPLRIAILLPFRLSNNRTQSQIPRVSVLTDCAGSGVPAKSTESGEDIEVGGQVPH